MKRRGHLEEDAGGGEKVAKRARTDASTAIVARDVEGGSGDGKSEKEDAKGLHFLKEENFVLEGHRADVSAVSFSPSGRALLSTSFDRKYMLWDILDDGEVVNFCSKVAHKKPVTDAAWGALEDGRFFTCSADGSVGVWDARRQCKERSLTHHVSVANSCDAAGNLVASCGDDGRVFLSDERDGHEKVMRIETPYPLCAVALGKDAKRLWCGGIANDVLEYDLRSLPKATRVLRGHQHTVTGLAVAPDGSHIISNGMDNRMLRWDVRPFVEGGDDARNVTTYEGSRNGFEENLIRCDWSSDGVLIAGGSADNIVYCWEAEGQLAYRLPGHRGTVNSVAFHPKQKVLASGSADGTIIIGELSW